MTLDSLSLSPRGETDGHPTKPLLDLCKQENARSSEVNYNKDSVMIPHLIPILQAVYRSRIPGCKRLVPLEEEP